MNLALRSLALAVACLLLTAAPTFAQLSTAQLSGRVTDQHGGIVQGANVTAVQTDTGYTRNALTDANGLYLLANLPPGPYRLQISLQKFRTYDHTGIVLHVATSQVIDAMLTVGLENTVTVEATRPLVDAQSSGLRAVVRNEEILTLPLNGRNPVELVTTTGAAVHTISAGVTAPPGGMGISVAGGQSFGVMYVLDGAMHNSPQNNLNLPFPFPDALQEFSVATSALSAEYGMHATAAVTAVTKAGTNRFAGNAFEFFRDRRFSATNPFAALRADGKRMDDGLQRNQFGGTAGGPLIRDKLFFFGAYQGTAVRQQPAANIAWVPTPAMLAGDFTAIASPACNRGTQINLRGGFENNRIDPALFSRAALNLVKYLPSTTDPCGQVTYALRKDSNEAQFLGRIDYQRTPNSMFGRYLATSYTQSVPMGASDTPLSLFDAANNRAESGFDDLAQSLAIGDTRVFGNNRVNSLRFAFNRTAVRRISQDTFDPYDLGADAYSYYPHIMTVIVQGAFRIDNQGPSRFVANAAQLTDDLTLVRGAHQISVGGSVAYWRYRLQAQARSGGLWDFTGALTGLALADLLMGRVGSLQHSGPASLPMDQWYLGIYAQDSWRARRRMTINAGVRWEPYFGQNVLNGAIYNFSLENFRNNVKSTMFTNAPAGLIYPGDPGFPPGRSGLYTQWWNLSPRVGLAWDVGGNGRTALRAAYGLAYDFPAAEYHLMNAQAAPFGNRTSVRDPPGGFDRPYAHLGGDPHPIVTSRDVQYFRDGAFGATDPHINSPRIQQWNVTIERQIGAAWQVAASYLGSHTDRLWNQVPLNPAVFLGLGPCTLGGVFYASCSTTTTENLNLRRELSLSGQNPDAARLIGNVELHTNRGTQDYRGLKLSSQRRAAGVSLSGTYTVSRCYGDPSLQTGSFPVLGSAYTKPDDRGFDRGLCDQDRTHLASFTVAVQTPRLVRPALRSWASDWTISGIVTARSGAPINVIAGVDRAYTGIGNQRVNQVLANPYADLTLNDWLKAAAFELPAPGTLGNFRRNSLRGPGFWSVDAALSRVVSLNASRRVALRVEAFNLFNTFNRGVPDVNFNSPASFGRIRSVAGTPRVIQFGVRYTF
ncbi:MAG: carboxypeptidase-like regulatory domain-containing protein [Vicinamibacterales bacterium]